MKSVNFRKTYIPYTNLMVFKMKESAEGQVNKMLTKKLILIIFPIVIGVGLQDAKMGIAQIIRYNRILE